MKFKFPLILLLCFGLFLAGCSQTSVSRQPQTVPTTSAPLPKLGLCVGNEADAPQYYAFLEQAFSDAGFQVVCKDGGNDQSVQDAQVRTLIAEGCCVIVSEPIMVSAQEAVVQSCKDAGIPLVLINRQPEQAVLASYDKLYYVGFDQAEPARLQTEAVAALPDDGDLNADGTVSYVLLTGPEGFVDTLLHTEGTVLSEQNPPLAVYHTDWSMDGGRTACATALSQYGPDIEAILCINDAVTLGAVKAVEEGGWRAGQDVYLLGIGNDPALLALVAQGSVASTVIPDQASQADALVQNVTALMEGAAPQSVTLIPHITVTVDNASDHLE